MDFKRMATLGVLALALAVVVAPAGAWFGPFGGCGFGFGGLAVPPVPPIPPLGFGCGFGLGGFGLGLAGFGLGLAGFGIGLGGCGFC